MKPFLIKRWQLLLAVLAFPVVAFAQASLPVVDANGSLQTAVQAAQSKQWSLLVSAVVMLLVWGFEKLGLFDKLSTKLKPWVAIALTTVASVCASLIAHLPLTQALLAGLQGGMGAVALWEAAGQHLDAALTAPKT